MTQSDTGSEGNTSTSSLANNTKQRSRKWCFTLFDYNHDTINQLLSIKNCKYIFGEETCPSTNRKHLQGYLEYKNPVYFSSLKKQFPKIHLEKAKGDMKSNYNYCSKEGKFYTNLEIKKEVKVKKTNFDLELYNWQQNIINIIESESDERTIHWIIDEKGNQGKSWLCKYILSKYEDCIYFTGGKSSDITSQILLCEDYDPKICLFDLPRTSEGAISYNGIEQCKNGLVNSPKYKGGFKVFDCPHVIIFANFKPNLKSLSSDRWNIIEL